MRKISKLIVTALMIFTLIITLSPSKALGSNWPIGFDQAMANGTPSPYGHVNVTFGNNLPTKYEDSYTSKDLVVSGDLMTRRYYDNEGKAILDIHYNDHGNPTKHPKVPHRHNWSWPNGVLGNPVQGDWY